ncbi:type III pantothenate kinase [soil metagenome]
MLLAVDIGNTSTKFGIYDDEDLVSRFSIPTFRDQGQNALQKEIGPSLVHPVSKAIVCSVVPCAAAAVIEFLRKKQVSTLQASNDLDYGLTVRYEPLSALGTDRLVNALAAVEKYGAPAIVCSFGTATTMDVIDAKRVFLGGIIAPGIKTAARALKLNTAELPDISIEKPGRLIGNTTESAIRSGIILGHVAMIEGLIQRLTAEIKVNPVVIATGGFATLVAGMTKLIDTVDENLTLDGLRILNDRIAHE